MALDLRMDTHIEIQLVCVPDDDSANASLDLRWTRTTRCNLDPATTRTSQPPPTLSSTPCVPETLKVDPGLVLFQFFFAFFFCFLPDLDIVSPVFSSVFSRFLLSSHAVWSYQEFG